MIWPAIASFHSSSHSPLFSSPLVEGWRASLEGLWPQAALLMLWLMLSLCLQHPPGSTQPGSRHSRSIPPSVPLPGFSTTAQVASTPSSLRPSLFPGKLLSSPLSPLSPLFVCLSLPEDCRHPKDQNPIRVLGSRQCTAHSWHMFPDEHQGERGGGPSLKGLPRLPQVGVISAIPPPLPGRRGSPLSQPVCFTSVTCAPPTRLWEPVPTSEMASWLNRELCQTRGHRGTGWGRR